MAKFNLNIDFEYNRRNVVNNTFGTLNSKFSNNDCNKAIKRTSSSAMVLCEENDEIEGFVSSVASGTLDGLSYGVCVHHASLVRMFVTGQDLSFGDYVVCGAQTPPSTSNENLNHPLNTYGTTLVKKGAPVNFKWRVIAVDACNPNLYLIEAV
ncbi:hypothetical protein [Snodgrassella alvi]|uniref:hypothetical protein n=1 Tax=Snodgrassella alvi TaxID=1196083 RepID=UPI0009984721|nr:hypothetical protein [Snodgrassella alvi]OOX78156.1 hypothetical protein BGH94_10225 [Snodgrassella alvi]ORF00218.1 hypothetical protein BGH95_09120 [Snodgrassella alvi]